MLNINFDLTFFFQMLKTEDKVSLVKVFFLPTKNFFWSVEENISYHARENLAIYFHHYVSNL